MQSVGQVMPAGVLVTLPCPCTVTVSVKVGWGVVLVAVHVAVALLSHGMKGDDCLSVSRRFPDAEVLELNVPVMVTENANGPVSDDAAENVLPVILCGGVNCRVMTLSPVPQVPVVTDSAVIDVIAFPTTVKEIVFGFPMFLTGSKNHRIKFKRYEIAKNSC